jgi:spectrin beta
VLPRAHFLNSFLQAFENFLSGLSGSEGRVVSTLETGKGLVAEGNREKDKIITKLDEIQQLWEDLKELSHARQEVCT